MNEIQVYRRSVEVGTVFKAPAHVTFRWQESRKQFSIWYLSDAQDTHFYCVVPTGSDLPEHRNPYPQRTVPVIVATEILPDGYNAFHLVRFDWE